MAFGFHDIWRSPTRYIDTRKRAKSVTMSIAPMASQRVDCNRKKRELWNKIDVKGVVLPDYYILIARDIQW
jgi:hypothetical protein